MKSKILLLFCVFFLFSKSAFAQKATLFTIPHTDLRLSEYQENFNYLNFPCLARTYYLFNYNVINGGTTTNQTFICNQIVSKDSYNNLPILGLPSRIDHLTGIYSPIVNAYRLTPDAISNSSLLSQEYMEDSYIYNQTRFYYNIKQFYRPDDINDPLFTDPNKCNRKDYCNLFETKHGYYGLDLNGQQNQGVRNGRKSISPFSYSVEDYSFLLTYELDHVDEMEPIIPFKMRIAISNRRIENIWTNKAKALQKQNQKKSKAQCSFDAYCGFQNGELTTNLVLGYGNLVNYKDFPIPQYKPNLQLMAYVFVFQTFLNGGEPQLLLKMPSWIAGRIPAQLNTSTMSEGAIRNAGGNVDFSNHRKLTEHFLRDYLVEPNLEIKRLTQINPGEEYGYQYDALLTSTDDKESFYLDTGDFHNSFEIHDTRDIEVEDQETGEKIWVSNHEVVNTIEIPNHIDGHFYTLRLSENNKLFFHNKTDENLTIPFAHECLSPRPTQDHRVMLEGANFVLKVGDITVLEKRPEHAPDQFACMFPTEGPELIQTGEQFIEYHEQPSGNQKHYLLKNDRITIKDGNTIKVIEKSEYEAKRGIIKDMVPVQTFNLN